MLGTARRRAPRAGGRGHIATTLTVLWAAFVAGRPAAAQSPPISVGQVAVYVEDFKEAGTTPVLAGLGVSAAEFVRISLLPMSTVQVTRVRPDSAPRCRAPAAGQAQGNDFPRARSDAFYVVRGSVAGGAAGRREFTLGYTIERCRADTLTILLQETEPVLATDALDDLGLAARYVATILDREFPRTAVLVRPFEARVSGKVNLRPDTAARVAERARRSLIEAIWASPDLRLADAAATGFEIAAVVTLEGKGVPSAEITVRPAGGLDSSVTTRRIVRRSDLREFTTALADSALQALRELRDAQPFLSLSTDSLLVRGRHLACLDTAVSCTPDYGTGIAALTLATRRSDGSWPAFLGLGQAQLAASNPRAAELALRRALELVQRLMAIRQTDSLARGEAQILSALGDANSALGSYLTAASYYGSSLQGRPGQIEVCIKQARAYRFAGNRMKALRTLAAGMRRDPKAVALHQEAIDHLYDLGTTDADSLPAPVTELVSAVRLGPDSFQSTYAVPLVSLGARLRQAGADASARVMFEQALQLKKADTDTRGRAHAYLALDALGQVELAVGADNCLDLAYPGYDRARARRHLDSAAARPGPELTPSTRQWLLRLRAIAAMQDSSYQAALGLSDQLEEGNQAGAFLTAQIAFFWARHLEDSTYHACGDRVKPSRRVLDLYERASRALRPLVEARYQGADWYFRESNHSLGKDAETNRMLADILKDRPNDYSALVVRRYLCNEYLNPKDFVCSFSIVAKLDSMGEIGLPDTASLLDALEIALLAGQLPSARSRLAELSRLRLHPRDDAIATLYAVWLAAEPSPSAKLGGAFDAWSQRAGRVRTDAVDLRWTFNGAREALRRPEIRTRRMPADCADLLLAMIDALDDASARLPGELPKGCRSTAR